MFSKVKQQLVLQEPCKFCQCGVSLQPCQPPFSLFGSTPLMLSPPPFLLPVRELFCFVLFCCIPFISCLLEFFYVLFSLLLLATSHLRSLLIYLFLSDRFLSGTFVSVNILHNPALFCAQLGTKRRPFQLARRRGPQVAEEECKHHRLLESRLKEMGSHYGAFPVHDALWYTAALLAPTSH